MAFLVALEGQEENTGAWLSFTVTVNTQVVLFVPSVAVQVTVVTPLLNTWPVREANPLPVVAPVNVAVFDVIEQLSVAVELNSDPTDVYVQTPAAVFLVAFAGHTEKTGDWLSFTVTVNTQVAVLLPSDAVQVTVVTPLLNTLPANVAKPAPTVAPVSVAVLEVTEQLSVATELNSEPTAV